MNGETTGGDATGSGGATPLASGGSSTGGNAVSTTSGGSNAGVSSGGGTSSGGSSGAGATTGSGGAVEAGGSSGGTDGSGGADEGSGGSSSGDPVFHVFLLMGQSNMAGYDKATAEDKVEDPRITVLGFDDCAETGRTEGQWDVAAPPLHECWNGAVGPGDSFAKAMIEKYPEGDTIGLVPLAVSGSKIEPFMKSGGAEWNRIVSRAKNAQDKGGIIEGILFHQGESNCGDSAWPGKVQTLVSDLRSELNLGKVPFLAGELLYPGDCSQHNTQVAQIPGLVENGHVVSAAGLEMANGDEWNLHFSRSSTITLGKRYAETMIDALGL